MSSRVLLRGCAGMAALLIVLPFGIRAQANFRRELSRTPAGEVLDFRENGVWRRQARDIAARRSLLRGKAEAGGMVARGVFLPTVSGVLAVPTVFFRYQDAGTGEIFAAADLEARLFGAVPPGGLPYTIRTFYAEMSGGLFRFEGQAVGWFTLDGNEEDYTGVAGSCLGNPFGTLNCNGLFSVDASTRRIAGLTEAALKADPLIDFGAFDNDGPDGIPNSGDDDGVVDLIAFYHSEMDGACGGATNNHFWAHRSSLGGVVTSDAAAGGGFITIRDYVLQSGVGGAGGCDVAFPVAIGTSAHEFGHGLGLPDLYDVAGSSEGIGQWGLMGSGNWTTQESPARMTPLSLSELGWITIVDVTGNTTLNLPPITTSQTAYAIRATDPNPRGEYLILENRQGLLSDSAMVRVHCATSSVTFPANCGGGLAVWHVDSSKIAVSGPINQVNSGAIHGLTLMQADGAGDLEFGLNRGDAGDVWPGVASATVFDSVTNPAALKHADGLFFGVALTNITQISPHGNVSVEVSFPPPNAMSIAPSGFHANASEGSVTPIPETASLSIVGPGAASVGWNAAAAEGSWLNLSTVSGVGPGAIDWNRNPTGLTTGTYVDTITVSASGVAGSPAIIVDTLTIDPPLVLTVAPHSRIDTAMEGTTATWLDSSFVTFAGPGSATAAWTAAHGAGSWIIVFTAVGTGSGVVRWQRDPTGLAVGVYVDTITVTAVGAAGSPAMVVDSLVIQPALVMSVDPASASIAVPEGDTGVHPDSASISFSGAGAAGAQWSATHGAASWVTLGNSVGTGDGQLRWSRDPTGLVEGVYVDTITITAPGSLGSPAVLLDSLIVVQPAVLSVSADSVFLTAETGASPIVDSTGVVLTGPGAGAASWIATHGTAAWFVLTDSVGTGSGVVRWTTDPTGLTPGTYFDTLVVQSPGASGSPVNVPVTLEILEPLTLSVTPSSSRDTVPEGATVAAAGNAAVVLSGANNGQAAWTTGHGSSSWLTLNAAGGVGSGPITWSRNPTGLTAGVYVDTIVVSASGAAGSPATVVDSLVISAVDLPLTLQVNPTGRSAVGEAGNATALQDSVAVVLTGAGAITTPWSASHGSDPWLTLTNASGEGSGVLRWERNAANLQPGTYIDTISVLAFSAIGSPARVIDTLIVNPPNNPVTLAVSPTTRRSVAASGGRDVTIDSTDVLLTGPGADQIAWSAASNAAWSQLLTNQGVGSGRIRFMRSAELLMPGMYVATVNVTGGGLVAQFVDSLEVTAPQISVDDLIMEFLDGGALTNIQRQYLDSLGNHDGVFNLGDVLAYLDRERIQLSPDQRRILFRAVAPNGRERLEVEP